MATLSSSSYWAKVAQYCVLAILCLTLAVPVIGQDNSDAKASFARANDYIAENNYRAARIEMLNALAKDPEWKAARILQGQIYLKLKDPIAAEAEIKRARELGVEDAQLRHLMGHALLMQDKYERTKEVITSGTVAAEHVGYAQRILAEALLELEERDAARSAYDAAIKANDRNADLWVSIGRFRFLGGDEKGAIEAVDFAVELDNQNIDALLYRGELSRRQFGLTFALPWFERALEIDPDHIPTLIAYAQTLGDAGQYRDMLAASRRVLSLEPNNTYGYYLQAVLAARAGQFDLARSLMQRIQGRLDDQVAPKLLLCALELQAQNAMQADEYCEDVLLKQPHNPSAQQLLMRIKLMGGELEELKSDYNDGRFSSVSTGYASAIMALALQLEGDIEGATDHINTASASPNIFFRLLAEPENTNNLNLLINKEPGNVKHRIRYIRRLLNDGRADQAFAQARRLQVQYPDYVDSNLLAGDVEVVRRNYAKALTYFEKASSARFSFDVMVRMHDMLAQLGRGEQMQALLRRYLAANPHNLQAKHMLGLAYLDAGNADLAREALQEVRARRGDNTPLLLADLAIAQLRSGNGDGARRTAHKAYTILPMNAAVSFTYGETLWAIEERREDALDLYEKAVIIAPDNDLYRTRYNAASKEFADNKDAA